MGAHTHTHTQTRALVLKEMQKIEMSQSLVNVHYFKHLSNICKLQYKRQIKFKTDFLRFLDLKTIHL